ncbi:hypothetical protein BGO17_00335 [Candidatus Saccharibacteria bacterium 49-20]|nr:MAG: hypothetical protein BGO17_00335 [Candidatus Saccharibacteria bacterium 49-20]
MKFLEYINKMLRPFSMYTGIGLGLSGIFLVALLLSALGYFNFTPLALALSALVLVGTTYIASLLCGWLFGVKAYWESSIITGLILTLIFTPSADISQLVVLAFVGFIAGVSKYILTWRGRHIFNPAALAAVVICFTGLGAASWWVATPILTPVVALVVLISLYQSKRYWVVGTFLAITIPVLLIEFLIFGATFGESIWLLMSWPILFLAGIMLTEPLTLPPRRWQMYVVAAVTAVAFLLPIKIGAFQMTPALTLLIGNIVAAVFAGRYVLTLKLKKRTQLTPSTDEFVFETEKPFVYEPGQYMELMVPHKRADFRGIRRRFSITSQPNTKQISFGIKFYEPSSSFKRTLRTLGDGATIRATVVAGDFVLPKDEAKQLVFVAGGIGITPFISHLRAIKKNSRDITLVYAVGSAQELAYAQELTAFGIDVIVVAPEKPKDLPNDWKYSQGSRINYDELAAMVPDVSERWAYISGPTPFVQFGKKQLRKLGARGVKTDYFAGY